MSNNVSRNITGGGSGHSSGGRQLRWRAVAINRRPRFNGRQGSAGQFDIIGMMRHIMRYVSLYHIHHCHITISCPVLAKCFLFTELFVRRPECRQSLEVRCEKLKQIKTAFTQHKGGKTFTVCHMRRFSFKPDT